MKSINKKRFFKSIRKKWRSTLILIGILVLVFGVGITALVLLRRSSELDMTSAYSVKDEMYGTHGAESSAEKASSFASSYAVSSGNKSLEGVAISDTTKAGLFDLDHGTVMFAQDIHEKSYPASITKIMTALLAIENCEMDEIVTVPPEAVYMEDKGTHIALDAGEQLTVEECLYAILLASANDAAYALAEHVGGTYENFICMMNAKAKEIGCQNTNFTNPHGLPDENHVTSAYDMALITRAALQYDMFQTVSGAFYYEIPPTEHQKDLICMNNHHKMIGKTNFHNEEVFAGKNGYTNAAGHTLVTCAKRDDMSIICVVMKDQAEDVYQDTLDLLEYGLGGFSKVKISEDKTYYEDMLKRENPIFKNCVISEFNANSLYVILPKEISVTDLNIKFDYGGGERVTTQYFYENHLVGQLEFMVQGIQAESDNLENEVKSQVFENTENKSLFFKYSYTILAIIVGIFAVGVILKVSIEKHRSKSRLDSRWKRKNIRRKRR